MVAKVKIVCSRICVWIWICLSRKIFISTSTLQSWHNVMTSPMALFVTTLRTQTVQIINNHENCLASKATNSRKFKSNAPPEAFCSDKSKWTFLFIIRVMLYVYRPVCKILSWFTFYQTKCMTMILCLMGSSHWKVFLDFWKMKRINLSFLQKYLNILVKEFIFSKVKNLKP